MKITIEATSKEIAALLDSQQTRQMDQRFQINPIPARDYRQRVRDQLEQLQRSDLRKG